MSERRINEHMIFLETPRLRLRNVTEKDADIMHEYRNNKICNRYQRGQTKERTGIIALIKRRKDDEMTLSAPFMIAVALKDSDEMIGEIAAIPKDDSISLGYTFSCKYHRRGYAFESLNALIETLHKRYPECVFISYTDTENKPSMELLKKLGYKDMGYSSQLSSRIFSKYAKEEKYRKSQ